MDLAIFTPAIVAVLAGGFLMGGFAKGVTGIGLPLIAVPVAALVVPPQTALALMAAPIFLSNIWLVATSPGRRAIVRRFYPVLLLAFPCAAAASFVVVRVPPETLMIWLGIAVLTVVALQVTRFKPVIPPDREKAASYLTGALGGTLQGISGFSGVVYSTFLLSIKADKDLFAAAIAQFFLVSSFPLFTTLALEGILATDEGLVSLALAMPVLAGVWAGQWVRARMGPDLFRAILFALLTVIGLNLIRDGMGIQLW